MFLCLSPFSVSSLFALDLRGVNGILVWKIKNSLLCKTTNRKELYLWEFNVNQFKLWHLSEKPYNKHTVQDSSFKKYNLRVERMFFYEHDYFFVEKETFVNKIKIFFPSKKKKLHNSLSWRIKLYFFKPYKNQAPWPSGWVMILH